MKLEYFAARSHAEQQFGPPVYECSTFIIWRPSKADIGIELKLLRNGLFCFRINGNSGHYFKADVSRLLSKNLEGLFWNNGFSWALADRLAADFGEIVGPSHEAP
jgi:hypothetical protein